MSTGTAFWSFMPDEGIADLKRLSRGIDRAANEKKENLTNASVMNGMSSMVGSKSYISISNP